MGEANCGGRIWTGELSEEESLLGLQLKHPITTADGVWTSSPSEGAPLTTAFSKIKRSNNSQSKIRRAKILGHARRVLPNCRVFVPSCCWPFKPALEIVTSPWGSWQWAKI